MRKKNPTKSNKKPYKLSEYQEFVRFMALPRFFRAREYGFENESDFAKKFKINRATLTQWKKKDDFWNEVKRLWKKWGKERTPDVILGLYRTAVKQGRAAEALVWMKIIEDWKEKTGLEVSGELPIRVIEIEKYEPRKKKKS